MQFPQLRQLFAILFHMSFFNSAARRDLISKLGSFLCCFEALLLMRADSASKASVEFSYHTVEVGETMYKISQMYGMKVKKLYRRNLMNLGEEPEIGDELHLRKKKKPSAPVPVMYSSG